MTWLSWRQFRGQALRRTGPAGRGRAYVSPSPVRAAPLLHRHGATSHPVGTATSSPTLLTDKHRFLQNLSFVSSLVPALIGIFWGAPLVARELEAGTFRLAWTQSVTRTRWLAVKIAVVGLAACSPRASSACWSPGGRARWTGCSSTACSRTSSPSAGSSRRVRRLRLHHRPDRRPACPAHAARHGGHVLRVHRRPGRLHPLGPTTPAVAETQGHGVDGRPDRVRADVLLGSDEPARRRAAAAQRLGHVDGDRQQRGPEAHQ